MRDPTSQAAGARREGLRVHGPLSSACSSCLFPQLRSFEGACGRPLGELVVSGQQELLYWAANKLCPLLFAKALPLSKNILC